MMHQKGGFRDRYLAPSLVALLLLFAGTASSQNWLQINNNYQYRRLKAGRLDLPIGVGLPTSDRDTGTVYFNKLDSSLNVFTGLGWIKAGGGLSAVSSPLYTASGTIRVDTSNNGLQTKADNIRRLDSTKATIQTFYKSDGVLTGNRAVHGGGNSLFFRNLNYFNVDSVNSFMFSVGNVDYNDQYAYGNRWIWQGPDYFEQYISDTSQKSVDIYSEYHAGGWSLNYYDQRANIGGGISVNNTNAGLNHNKRIALSAPSILTSFSGAGDRIAKIDALGFLKAADTVFYSPVQPITIWGTDTSNGGLRISYEAGLLLDILSKSYQGHQQEFYISPYRSHLESRFLATGKVSYIETESDSLYSVVTIRADSLRLKGLPYKTSLAATDSVLIRDENFNTWLVPASAFGSGGGGGGSMVYPGAGIAVSTGSAWGTSITNNSSNWNTAYGWGNHASAGYELASNKSTTTTLGTSNTLYPSQLAVKTYVDNAIAGVSGGGGSTPNLQAVTTAGSTTTDVITAGGVKLPNSSYPTKLLDFGGLSTSAWLTLESGTRGFAFINASGGNSGFFTSAGSKVFTYNDAGNMLFGSGSIGTTYQVEINDYHGLGLTGGAALYVSGQVKVDNSALLKAIAAPGTPATGYGVTYVSSTDGKLHFISDSGTDYDVTATGGGAAWGAITGTLSSQTDLQSALDAKQATLVSGTNIKTINSTSLLGSGNISLPNYWTLDGSNNIYNNNTNEVYIGSTTDNGAYKLQVTGGIYNSGNYLYSAGTGAYIGGTDTYGYSYVSVSPAAISGGNSTSVLYAEKSTHNATVQSLADNTRSIASLGAGVNTIQVESDQVRIGLDGSTPANGKLYIDNLQSGTTSYVAYYNTSTKELTYGAAPSGSTGTVTGAANIAATVNTSNYAGLYSSVSSNVIQLKSLSAPPEGGMAVSALTNEVQLKNSGYDVYGRNALTTTDATTQTGKYFSMIPATAVAGVITVEVTGFNSSTEGTISTIRQIAFKTSASGTMTLGSEVVTKAVETIGTWTSGTPTFSFTISANEPKFNITGVGTDLIYWNVTYKVSYVNPSL